VSQVLVRDLEPVVINRLKSRAKLNGRSLEAELRVILRQAAGVATRSEVDDILNPSPSGPRDVDGPY
jgi:plasmid stability protein